MTVNSILEIELYDHNGFPWEVVSKPGFQGEPRQSPLKDTANLILKNVGNNSTKCTPVRTAQVSN